MLRSGSNRAAMALLLLPFLGAACDVLDLDTSCGPTQHADTEIFFRHEEGGRLTTSQVKANPLYQGSRLEGNLRIYSWETNFIEPACAKEHVSVAFEVIPTILSNPGSRGVTAKGEMYHYFMQPYTAEMNWGNLSVIKDLYSMTLNGGLNDVDWEKAGVRPSFYLRFELSIPSQNVLDNDERDLTALMDMILQINMKATYSQYKAPSGASILAP